MITRKKLGNIRNEGRAIKTVNIEVSKTDSSSIKLYKICFDS